MRRRQVRQPTLHPGAPFPRPPSLAPAYQQSRSGAYVAAILPSRMSEQRENGDRSLLERALGIVTDVKAGEGPTALFLTLNVFLLLTAYYVLKPVREGLILSTKNGAQY